MELNQDSEPTSSRSFSDRNWDSISSLFEKASKLDPEDRQAYLDEVCAGAPALRAELESLLKYNDEATSEDWLNRIVPVSAKEFNALEHYKAGEMIGHYQIVEKIGHGGMGFVYKAKDIRLERMVALKFLPAYLSESEKSWQRFIQEARVASSIDHPNICTVYEIRDLSNGSGFISMAFYEGQTLQKLIEKGPVNIDKAIDIVLQMCAGLAQAHARGIVHRDVKPANIMLTAESVVKILDFGVAKNVNLELTKTGDTIGTVYYMAPEQILGEKIDHRVDIWAIGMILYELLTGQRPFGTGHSLSVVNSILNKDPQPVTGFQTGIPLQLAHIVQRLLSKTPEDRHNNLKELIDDLVSVRDRNAARESDKESVLVTYSTDTSESADPSVEEDEDQALRILFVDDEPEFELLIRSLFRKKAKKNKWVLDFALSGKEALDHLKANPDVALVLTDLNMPEMDGLTLLDRIHELNRPLKTVVVTAYSDVGNIRAAMNRGAFDFVVKPVNVADLEATILKCAQEWRTAMKASSFERQLVSLQKELDVARQIQEAIQPVGFEPTSGVDLYAFSMVAHEISGTFYDYYWIDETRVGLLLGDVGGKGVSAAVVMAMVQTYFKSIAAQGHDPGTCMTMVNQLVVPEGFPDLSVRAFYGVFDTQTGTLSYSNAGHHRASLIKSGPTIEPRLASVAPPLWRQQDLKYETSRRSLDHGDTLFLYTRGVEEAKNPSGTRFSLERIAKILQESQTKVPRELIRNTIRSILAFTEDIPLKEDLTLLSLQRKGSNTSS
ncbi:MAG: SpoIIE family protein phosphatase [Rhodothermaceae bacterium]|nr:SpoIIE family protein phosphatase [Rhodothermaceae bacterium]